MVIYMPKCLYRFFVVSECSGIDNLPTNIKQLQRIHNIFFKDGNMISVKTLDLSILYANASEQLKFIAKKECIRD